MNFQEESTTTYERLALDAPGFCAITITPSYAVDIFLWYFMQRSTGSTTFCRYLMGETAAQLELHYHMVIGCNVLGFELVRMTLQKLHRQLAAS